MPFRRSAIAFLFVPFIGQFCAQSAQADILVQAGDRLSVVVTGAPDLSREANVDADGKIILPVLGGVAVAGLDLDAVRKLIATTLTERAVMQTPSVLVEVASYRPFYVGGAVARPGAIPFSPGLTVRQALVTAGGLDRTGRVLPITSDQVVDLLSRGRATSYQLLQVNSHIARLQAELMQSEDLNLDQVDHSMVPASEVAPVVDLDRKILSERLAQRSANADHMAKALDLVGVEIDVLSKQASIEQDQVTSQRTEIGNMRKLVDKGLVPAPQLRQMEREASLQARDLLENQAFQARARQAQETARFDIGAAAVAWKLGLRNELRDALQSRATLQAEVEALSNRLMAAGVSLGVDTAMTQVVPAFTIHRTALGAPETISATMDSAILPGDVLDVSIPPPPRG